VANFILYICLMIRILSKHKWLYHSAFWIVALVFLSLFFGRFNRSTYYAFLFTVYQLPVIIATTYTINYWLIPKFLFQKHYGRFVYFLIGTVLVSIWLNALISIFAFIKTYNFEMEAMPLASFDFFFLTAGLYLIILVGVVFHLVKESFKQQEEKFKLQEKQIETDLKLKESKLKLLQGQLHPHMLFNSLNTIYGFSLQKSDKASNLIINLSNLLDYMLYHCDVERIPLDKEIEFLDNFIEIEKHKFSEEIDLHIEWPVKTDDYLIAPLVLLPFCENCFKHSKHTKEQKPIITIKSSITDNKLLFEALNSFDPEQKPVKDGGVGIQNVRERLNLIYPNYHELTISQENNLYIIKLSLELDKLAN